MHRGDIYYIKLGDDGVGSEQKGDRFAVIVQNDTGNRYSPTVIVAMITSSLHNSTLPTHVKINYKNSGLLRPSTILCEQLRTVDKKRLVEKIGSLSQEKILELDKALSISLNL